RPHRIRPANGRPPRNNARPAFQYGDALWSGVVWRDGGLSARIRWARWYTRTLRGCFDNGKPEGLETKRTCHDRYLRRLCRLYRRWVPDVFAWSCLAADAGHL